MSTNLQKRGSESKNHYKQMNTHSHDYNGYQVWRDKSGTWTAASSGRFAFASSLERLYQILDENRFFNRFFNHKEFLTP